MIVQTGFEDTQLRALPRFFGFCYPVQQRLLVTGFVRTGAILVLAGLFEIDDLCHAPSFCCKPSVAQKDREVYLIRMKAVTYLKAHWQLFAMTLVVFACWNLPVIWPLKVLVVFLHEASHALAALLTGGRVDEISLSVLEGGHVISRGGNLFLIISAGYLGSLLLGSALFIFGLHTTWDRTMVAGLGVIMIALALIYMRELFPLVFCLGTGVVLLGVARFLDQRVSDLVLRIIGLTSMIYVPYDIFSDTILRSHLNSDARIMSQMIGGPTLFWGVLWLVISVVVVAAVLRYALTASSNIEIKRRL